MASTCEVCEENYNADDPKRVPKILPCGHTFCSTCLERLIVRDSIRCPRCRRNTPGIKTVADVPRNFALIEILSKAHSKCKQHDENLKLFCNVDQVPICYLCNIAGSHAGHDISLLTDVSKKSKASLKKHIRSLESRVSELTKFHTGITQRTAAVTRDCDHAKVEIQDKFDELIQSLNRRKDFLFKQVEDHREAEEKCLGDLKSKIGHSISEFTARRKKADTVLGQNNDIVVVNEFLRIGPSIGATLNDMHQLYIRAKMRRLFTGVTVEVQFNDTTNDLLSYGAVITTNSRNEPGIGGSYQNDDEKTEGIPTEKKRFDFKSASGVWYNEGKQMEISECLVITIDDQQFSAIQYNFKDDKFFLQHKESCFLQQHSASELLFSDEQEDGYKLRLTREPGLGGSYQNDDEKTEGIPTEKLLKLDEIEKSKLLYSPEIPHKLGKIHEGVTLKFANGDYLLCGRQAQLDDAEETLRVILSILKYEVLTYTYEFCGRILRNKHDISAGTGVVVLEHNDRNKLILIGEDNQARFVRDLIKKESNQASPFSRVQQRLVKPNEKLLQSVHYYKTKHSSLQTLHKALQSQHAKMANKIKTLKRENNKLYESNEIAERQETENYGLRQTVKGLKKKLKAVANDKRELGVFIRRQTDDLNNTKEQCQQLGKRLKGAHGELDRARKELTDTSDELARSKRIISEHLSNTHKLMLIDDEGKHQQTSVISGEFPLTSEIIQSFDNLKVDTRVNTQEE